MPKSIGGLRTIWDVTYGIGPHPMPQTYPYDNWDPYCVRCTGFIRMMPTTYGWTCPIHKLPVGPDLTLRVGPFAWDPVVGWRGALQCMEA